MQPPQGGLFARLRQRASEISAAEELGVEIVKIFPGSQVGGPGFVKAVRGPMPWTYIMPTGGVSPDRGKSARLVRSRRGLRGHGQQAGAQGPGGDRRLRGRHRGCKANAGVDPGDTADTLFFTNSQWLFFIKTNGTKLLRFIFPRRTSSDSNTALGYVIHD